ncbi:MAG: hypothetical protein PHE67_12805 [Campylobacterales bacterium]|nr:hypothetical protein [Campylobacterales bacterium]
MKPIIFIFAMLFSSILFGTETIKELKNDSDTMVLQIDTTYRMGDADSKQSAKRAILEKVKVVASEYAGTYVESNVELTNGRMTKDEIATLSRAFVSQKIVKESFKMLPNGFMVLEATVESTLDRKSIMDKLETVSKSEENKAKIAQIQADNTKLQSELEEVSKELLSLKDSTAALAQQLFAKREEIYKKLDANDNIVLTKLNKKEVLSQAVQLKQAYDKDMDEFKCKVNANLYILEKILTPKVKSTKVDFDGKNYSLRVVVQLGENLSNINREFNSRNKIENPSALVRFFNIGLYEKYSDEKYEYIGFPQKQRNKNQMNFAGNYRKTLNPKTLDLLITLDGEHELRDTLAYYDKVPESIRSSKEYIKFFAVAQEWENDGGFLTKEYVLKNLSAEDVANFEAVSLQVKGNYEHSECVEKKYNNMIKTRRYKKYKNQSYADDKGQNQSFAVKAHVNELVRNYTRIGLQKEYNAPRNNNIEMDWHVDFSLDVLNALGWDISKGRTKYLTKDFPLPNFNSLERSEVLSVIALIDRITTYEQWRIEKILDKSLNVSKRSFGVQWYSKGYAEVEVEYIQKTFSVPFF